MKHFFFLCFLSSHTFASDINQVMGTFETTSNPSHHLTTQKESSYMTGTFASDSKKNREPSSIEEQSSKKTYEKNVTDLTGTFK